MMTSSRPRNVGGSFASRRGHAPQLSISDPSHHVTEAIGTLYGDSDDDSGSESRQESTSIPTEGRRKERPLSFLASPAGGEQIIQTMSKKVDAPDERQQGLVRSASEKVLVPVSPDKSVNGGIKKAQTLPPRMPSRRGKSYEGGGLSPSSPTLSLREVQQADSAQFPLTNIDNPKDIAQELSNLQALRRMSMDVGNNKDPDLMPFQGISLMAMPTIAPTGEDDEGDLSRLLWVPAKVHPELAPDQFKNFLENRVKTIKRRSGDSMLSVDGLDRSNSGSLRRKKSMLSRQVDNSAGTGGEDYVDGAERLERKTSGSSGRATPELSLNELVKDPTKAVQKLAQETQEAGVGEDMPILPVAPGMGLRRSTRTTYRKGGSLRYGDRVPFSKRVAAREAEKGASEKPAVDDDTVPPVPKIEAPPGHALSRVRTEPLPAAENFSRPTRSVKRQPPFQRDTATLASPASPASSTGTPIPPTQRYSEDSPVAASPSVKSKYPDRPQTVDSSRFTTSSIPQIVETPPPSAEDDAQLQSAQSSSQFPQRSSSQKALHQQKQQQEPQQQQQQQQQQKPSPSPQQQQKQPPPRSTKWPSTAKSSQQSSAAVQSQVEQAAAQLQGQTPHDMAHHPSPLPGGGATRTDGLTFIPTLAADDKKTDKKAKEKDEGESTKSTGWKWFRGEEREKKKREKEEQAKKARSRTSAEKGHDSARLDVLQNSIDTALQKGRESLLLDRDTIDNKLHEERKRESNRKSGESKKEKDGFFGSIFGGKSKKSDKDHGSGRGKQRALSPEPPVRPLRPDVDYPYTRFKIVEERAIYRMAHIKLANPRRSLLSQVLLSNFMYSYLAKVQAMHPQLNVPISPQQKRLEEERKRREQEQQYLMEQQMQAQEMEQDSGQNNFDHYNFEYHRSASQYADPQDQDASVDYMDDSQLYEYEHSQREQQQQQQHYDHSDHADRQDQQHNGGYEKGQGGGRHYYEYEQHEGGGRRRERERQQERDDEMW